MKKKVLIGLCLTLFITSLAMVQSARDDILFVAVNTVDLKAGTGIFARTVGTLNYGDQVDVLQERNRFVQVQNITNPSLTGWTGEANFTSRQTAGAGTGADARDVAQAARGFDKNVEKEFSNQHPELNFEDIDKMERITIDLDKFIQFLEEGRLAKGGN